MTGAEFARLSAYRDTIGFLVLAGALIWIAVEAWLEIRPWLRRVARRML